MAPPVAPRLPVIHRRAAGEEDPQGPRGFSAGILPGRVLVCLGGEIARFFREELHKHCGRRAEDSTRTSRDLIWGMRGETISLRMPQHSFRARSIVRVARRGPLPQFLNRAVLPPCFLPKPRDARMHDEPRRDPRRSPQPHAEPPPLPGSLSFTAERPSKGSASIRVSSSQPPYLPSRLVAPRSSPATWSVPMPTKPSAAVLDRNSKREPGYNRHESGRPVGRPFFANRSEGMGAEK